MTNALSITRNAAVDDNIIVLDHHDTIGGYAEAYGNQIAEWYEQDKIIVIPYWPLAADMSYLQTVTLPSEMAKIGSANRVDGPLLRRRQDGSLVSANPLMMVKMEMADREYLRSQFSLMFSIIRGDIATLFPHYKMTELNITTRMTPTRNCGMHIDTFKRSISGHRLKFFINIDSEPRLWNTSYTMVRALEVYRDRLSDIPANMDRNDLGLVLNERLSTNIPFHTIAYPGLSCVIANGETIFHQVTYGNRMIAGEYSVDTQSMMCPENFIARRLPQVMDRLGYGLRAA